MTILGGLLRGLFVTATFAVAFACSNSKSTGAKDAGLTTGSGGFMNFCELPKQCQDIAQACMPKDDGSKGTVHDCHLTGHETGTLAACSAVYDKCIKACNAAPALSDGPVEDLSAPCRDAAAKSQ
jgi:hypothetical protein